MDLMQESRKKKKIDLKWFVPGFGRRLALPKHKPPKPILVAPAGPSRVGKTTVMKYIQKCLPYFVRIAHDDMRLFLYKRGWPDSPRVENLIYDSYATYALAEEFLKKGHSIILDDNFASWPKKAEKTKRLAAKFNTKFFIVRIDAPVGIVRRRLHGVKSKLFPDWRVGLAHFERSRKQFDYDKFNKIYLAKINTARPLAPQLKNTVATLKKAMGFVGPQTEFISRKKHHGA